MDALENFLNTLPDTFDFTTLLDPDVEAIESTIYTKSTIYKYYPAMRRGFFEKPQVRFSPREALNDPLEMTRRWRETSAEGLKKYVADRLSVSLPATFTNKDLLNSMLADEFVANGQPITGAQRSGADDFFKSNAGQDFLNNQLSVAHGLLAPILESVFTKVQADFDQIVSTVVSSVGVLSLTEDPLNDQMWTCYADRGEGFVVGLNSRHAFFTHADGSTQRSLLKKLIYTDQHTENFWRNPYYLFLVKGISWAYENEWRMIKKFADSDESILSVDPQVHLWNVLPEMIKTIHFGYNYDPREIPANIQHLLRTGANPTFYQVVVDSVSGSFQEELIA
jgi:hypothetical protein